MDDHGPTPHPATFPDHILVAIRDLLVDNLYLWPSLTVDILDPFAGIGTVAKLKPMLEGREPADGVLVNVWGIELEEEWWLQAQQLANTMSFVNFANDDCLAVMARWREEQVPKFTHVVTSPSYGNRMADKYAGDAKGTRRHTYRTYLGRDLSDGSSAVMQWGAEYRAFHADAWGLTVDLLVDGGLFLLNIKDHVRAGEVQQVSRWHMTTLVDLGLELVDLVQVPTGGIRHGQNHQARVGHENLMLFRKATGT